MATAALLGLVGTGITAAAGIGSSVANSVSSKRMAQQSNDWNLRMLQMQQEYNTKMTDPAFQKERLQNAGFNPALVFQNGSLGSVGNNPAAAQAVTPQIDTSQALQGIGQGIDAYIRMKQASSQTANMDASTNNLRIEGQYIAAKSVAELTKLREEAKSIETKRMIDEITKQFLPQMSSAQLNYLNSENQQLQMQIKLQNVEYMMQSQRLKQFPTQLKLELAGMSADIALKLAQKQLTDKQAETEVQKAAESIVRQESGRLSNEFSRKTMTERIETVKAEMWRAISNSGSDNYLQFIQGIGAPKRREKVATSPSGYGLYRID